MTRIVFFCPSPLLPTGIGKVARRFIRGLVESGYQVVVGNFQHVGEPLTVDGAVHFPLFDADTIPIFLEKTQPDLAIGYFSHWVPPYSQIPQICEKMGIRYMQYVTLEFSSVSLHWLEPLTHCNFFAVSSDFGRKLLLKHGVSEEKIKVVYHGVDMSIYRPIEPRPRFAGYEDKFFFGFVARNSVRKGFSHIIRAFAMLPKEVKENSMLYFHTARKEESVSMLGPTRGWDIPLLAIKYNLQGKILLPDERATKWMGYSEEELARTYNALDVYVHASSGEGFCTSPDTKIITGDGVKAIGELTLSDKVLTHTGRLKRILKLYQRFYRGPIITIRTWKTNEVIRLTPEHPVLVSKKEGRNLSPPTWITAEKVEKGDILILPIPKQIYDDVTFDLGKLPRVQFDDKHAWHSSQYSLRKSKVDKLKLPRFVRLDEELAKLIGWYIAEGDAGNLRGVGFSFAKDEKDYANEVISLMRKVFDLEPNIKTRKGKNVTHIWFSSKVLAQFFTSLAGKGAKNKKIPKELLYGDTNLLRLCLDRAFRGDGCVVKGKKHYTTASESLAYQLRVAHLRFGSPISVNREVRIRRFHTDEYFKQTEYKLEVTPPSEKSKHSRKAFKINDEYVGFRVREVEIKHYDGFVCNLEVEDDESYCTANFVVHNCLPVLEAMACGLPIIASNNTAISEVVGDAGILTPCFEEDDETLDGFTISSPKIRPIAEAMLELYQNETLRRKLRKLAQERARKFTWSRAIEGFCEAVEHALEQDRIGPGILKASEPIEAEGVWTPHVNLIPEGKGRCLDVGSGPSTLWRYVIEEKGYEYVSLDRKSSKKVNVVAEVPPIPFGDKSFELVFSRNMLEHLPTEKQMEFLKECQRVGKRALVIFTTPESPNFYIDPDHYPIDEKVYSFAKFIKDNGNGIIIIEDETGRESKTA